MPCEISEISVRDQKDAFLLLMAHDVSADYLITEDQDFLKLEKFEETTILHSQNSCQILNFQQLAENLEYIDNQLIKCVCTKLSTPEP